MKRQTSPRKTVDGLGAIHAVPRARAAVCAVILAGAVILVFSSGIRGQFVFDDLEAIVENPTIRRLSNLKEVLCPPVDTTVAGRPLVNLSLAINYAVGGLAPEGYHWFNIAVHAAAALLLFGILRRVLADSRERQADWMALAIALLWAVHPLQTESVTYVSTRTESMAGMFLLATLYSAIRAIETERSRDRLGWTALAIIASAMGMGTKEVMAVAPVIVLLFDWLMIQRRRASRRPAGGSAGAGERTSALTDQRGHSQVRPGATDRPALFAILRARPGLYVGLAATWVIVAWLTLAGARGKSVGFAYSEATPLQYAMTQAGVVVHYLRLALWPAPLALDYQDWPVAKSIVEVWPHALLVAGLLALTVAGLARRHPAGAAAACFFLILAPTSSFIPIVTEIAAERRMYLPLAVVVTLLALGVHRALGRVVNGPAARVVVLFIVTSAATAALSAATMARNRLYADPEALWRQTIAVRPQNVRALHNLGLVLASTGRWAEAEKYFRRSVQIEPRYARAQTGLAMALTVAGRLDEAEEVFATAIRLDPQEGSARLGLGNVFMSRGQWSKAAEHFGEGVRLRPTDSRARSNFGLALRNAGRVAEAAEQFRAALALDPTDWLANGQLGWLMLEAGRKDEAAAHFEAALRVRPDDGELRRGLAVARQ